MSGRRAITGAVGVEPHDVPAAPRQLGSRSSSADCVTSTGAAGIGQHEGQPLARIVRIERQIGAAGLEDAEQPDHHLGRALDAQPHHGLGADAEALQMMRQPVGVGVERRVGQRAILEHHRDRVRRAHSLRGKQRRQVSGGTGCAVSFQLAQDGVALGGLQDRQAAERPRGVRHRGLQQPDETPADDLDRRFVEQVAGVFQHAVDAARRAVGEPTLDEPDRQIELRARGRDRLRRDGKPRQLSVEAPASPASNASITWNSGCRDSDRAGLSTSTSRSNGSSWCP